MNYQNINPNIKTIYLHIGTFKTATTSIQHTLYYNHKILSKIQKGYFYSNLTINQSIISFIIFEPQSFKKLYFPWKSIISTKKLITIRKNIISDLISEIKTCSAESIIFSGEAMTKLDISSLFNLKKTLLKAFPKSQIKIILFTRNHLDFLTSFSQQYAKTIGTIYDIPNFYYKDLIEKFINVFSKDSLIIHSFEESLQHKYGPTGYFLNLIGITDVEMSDFTFYKKNTSFSSSAIDIIQFSYALIARDYKNIYLNFSILNKLSGQKFSLGNNSLNNYNQRVYQDAIWLNENYNIDYTYNNKKHHTNSNQKSISYNQNNINQIIDLFPKLRLLEKKLIFLYFYQKQQNFSENHTNKKKFQIITNSILQKYNFLKIIPLKFFIWLRLFYLLLKKIQFLFVDLTILFYDKK